MSFKAASGHQNRFIVKTEVSIPWNSTVEYDSVMDGNIGAKDSVAGDKKQENTQFGIRGWENQPEKVNKFCFNK